MIRAMEGKTRKELADEYGTEKYFSYLIIQLSVLDSLISLPTANLGDCQPLLLSVAWSLCLGITQCTVQWVNILATLETDKEIVLMTLFILLVSRL